jgi:hypothetical protein
VRRPATFTVRCLGPGSLRARWYRSLAHAVVATPSPCGVLFETDRPGESPWVTGRPRSLVETVSSSPLGATAPLESRSEPPRLEPPRGWFGQLRSVVVPARGPPSLSPSPPVGRDLPNLGRLVGPRAWVAVQTAWIRGESGELWCARRAWFAAPTRAEFERRVDAVATAVAEEWTTCVGVPATTSPLPRSAVRDWRRGTLATVPRNGWLLRPADGVDGSAEVRWEGRSPTAEGVAEHGVVFGASGAGKTTFLVRHAVREVERGTSVVVIDLHGDLAPAILAHLRPAARHRVVAVDASTRPVPGVAALAPSSGVDDRAAAHLVAAVKRLSPDGTDLYWGFRLERVFDSFVRLVQESDGSLVDLYALLTDADRRDAARLATRREDLARFLEELGPILRRHPDFLWSAATRLSKVVLVPGLEELLAPRDGGLPVEDLVEQGRSILVRLPFTVLGPEAAAFAGTLVLSRLYLGLAARRRGGDRSHPVLLVLDEAHGFAPRLVAEVLTESRKFGLRALIATQYPDHLAPEVRAAAAGAAADFLTFRVPPASARLVGGWVGLPADLAERWLPGLPPGHGVRLDPDSGTVRPVLAEGPLADCGPAAWSQALLACREEFGVESVTRGGTGPNEDGVERLLLATLAAEEEGRSLNRTDPVDAALALPGATPSVEALDRCWRDVVRQGYVDATPKGWRLTPAGERRLGLSAPTLAVKETGEHRALLVAAFRVFARRGYRIEILRQGRFDTRLPDGFFRQVSLGSHPPPFALAAELDRARRGWAWRCFGGRDVHLEAEVSGALRPERIRRGWHKAAERGAFALFLVADAARARKVRATLRALGVGPDRAQVWTLSVARGRRPDPLVAPGPNP